MAKIMKILLLLLLFAANATSATKTKCNELIGTVSLTNDPDICDVFTTGKGLAPVGNIYDLMTLDFSKADETTLNTFLAKFDEIYGAIVMDGNEQVTTLDFAKLKSFDGKTIPSDAMFIVIRNNPKLANIVWNEKLAVGAIGPTNIHVLIYNNPLLDANSLKKVRDLANGQSMLASYIQETGFNECQFEYPLKMATPDPSKYIAPSAEFLKNCKKIKGDFIVENAKLAGLGPFELGADACLRLVNVDMKDVKITGAANTGSETCKDGTKSEITGNPNVCGDELETLHKYYKDPAAVAVKMDTDTCTKPCSSGQQSSLYIHCEATTPPPPPTTIPPSTNSTIAAGAMLQPTSNTTSNSNDSPSDESNPWLIPVIIAVSVLAVFAIITLPVLWWMNCLPCCRRHKDDPKKKDPPGGKNKDRGNKQKPEHPHDKPKMKPAAVEDGNVTDGTASDVTSNSKEKIMEPIGYKYTLENIDETAEHGAVLKTGTVKSKEKAKPSKEKSKERKTRTASLETAEPKKSKAFSPHSNKQKSNEMKKKQNKKKNSRKKAKKANRRKSASTSAEDTSGSEPDENIQDPLPPDDTNVYTFESVVKLLMTALIALSCTRGGLRSEFLLLDYKGVNGNPLKHIDTEDADLTQLLHRLGILHYGNMTVRKDTVVTLKHGQYVSANSFRGVGREYICAEAPFEKMTAARFLRMIFEKKVENAIMLCKFFENGVPQCYEYIPLKPGSSKKFTDGKYKIRIECLREKNVAPTIIQRDLVLTVNGVSHYFTHYHFTSWPDHGIPTIEDGMKLFPLLETAKISINKDAPILVHCSAGVGRTGVVVLLSMVMDTLKKGHEVKIWELFKFLRSQRANAIQTYHQLLFVFILLMKKLIPFLTGNSKLNAEDHFGRLDAESKWLHERAADRKIAAERDAAERAVAERAAAERDAAERDAAIETTSKERTSSEKLSNEKPSNEKVSKETTSKERTENEEAPEETENVKTAKENDL